MTLYGTLNALKTRLGHKLTRIREEGQIAEPIREKDRLVQKRPRTLLRVDNQRTLTSVG